MSYEAIVWPTGHILGSALVEMEAGRKLLVFSGDLGRSDPKLAVAKQLERVELS